MLSEQLQAELECHRLAYADLLHRWGHDVQRAQVLSLTTAAASQQRPSTDSNRRHTLAHERIRDGCGFDDGARLAFANVCHPLRQRAQGSLVRVVRAVSSASQEDGLRNLP